MRKEIKELSKKYAERCMAIRREIHANPELGYQEFKTSKLIKEELGKLDIEVTSMAKTGVVGLLRGKYPGKTVLLRADMDALYVEEKADVEYKSKVDGVMHACGHDGHVAGLLGAAMILNDLKEELHGNVKFVFQPAEETVGGAKPMINEGVLENPRVDAAFGAHLWGPLKEGEIGIKSGDLMAAPDEFNFKVIGKGGHGAMPQLSIDPIVLTAQVINAMQTLISRRADPLDTVVLSFGKIQGGESFNVIPDTIEVSGTVRTFKDKTREEIPRLMEDIIKGITNSQGGSYEFKYRNIYPALINDEAMTNVAKSSLVELLGDDKVKELKEPNMGGEDFSYFCREVPSAYFFVGISEDDKNPTINHNPYFKWDDKNVMVISESFSKIVVDFLDCQTN